uniref:Rx N-terminal domain-containing protein n=1 Tax=Hordeum vulgare subsp. vulgare TaxID=112509 RepID=A0A8I6X0E0_HORVV
MNKYNSSSHVQSEEKVAQRLQHLLMRAGTIIEEADTRYITNSGMMMQLKILSEAMYRGYSELDNLRYRALQDGAGCFDKVSINDSSSSSLHLSLPFKRSRITTEKDDKVKRLGSHGALESLEVAIANMAEFIILLGGCKRMFHRPYDIYLYTENFMFGRHTEKQKLLSFLLEHNNPPTDHAPAVLPIIGGASIGKKTLVAHVCGDERVRSHFSSILHLNGHNLFSLLDHGRTMFGTTLVVIEFSSDVRSSS